MNLEEYVTSFKEGRLKKSELVNGVHIVAEKTSGNFQDSNERLSNEGDEGKYKELLEQEKKFLKEIPYKNGRDRSFQLAWLDIVLDSEYYGGASGKGATYSSVLISRMFEVAQGIKAPQKMIAHIRTLAKDRYNLELE